MKVGSLCTGYGGLDMAVGGELAWVSEVDRDASAVLELRHPGVPNLGDLTAVDWAEVEPVDVLTAGFPCQPVSTAGKRAGVDDERWLFDDIADAVGRMVVRPRLLVFENVRGLLSANGGHAMARVVHGLAGLGFVGRWGVVRASDAGAPHGRARWFCVAHADGERLAGWPELDGEPPSGWLPERADRGHLVGLGVEAEPLTLLPTPCATEPSRSHSSAAKRLEAGQQVDLATAVALHLLPTPEASDGTGGRHATNLRWEGDTAYRPSGAKAAVSLREAVDRWGRYAAAVARWEHVIGRPAPAPLDDRGRLNPWFVEWMMGLPEGWVCDSGVPRTAQLRILGNGVVPQQASLALELLS